MRLCKQGRYFLVPEPGNPAPDAGHEEEQLRMFLGKRDEVIDIRLDGLDATLHRRDCIALAAETDPAAHHRTEELECSVGGTAAVHSGEIAAEDEHLVFFQGVDMIRCVLRPGDAAVNSFVCHNTNLTIIFGIRSDFQEIRSNSPNSESFKTHAYNPGISVFSGDDTIPKYRVMYFGPNFKS